MSGAAVPILVAEPDGLQRQLIDMLLSSGDFEPTMVATGREALEHLRGATPALALLAMDLPDLPGDAICGKIRRVSRLASVPVVLIAPQEGRFGLSDEARSRARAVAADLVLPRPLGDKNLRERLSALAAGAPAAAPVPVPEPELTLHEFPAPDAPIEPEPAAPARRPAAAPPAGDDEVRELHREIAALRLENEALRRKLRDARATLAEGRDPEARRLLDELERRNRALLEALEERKGRDEDRGGGLFGRRR